MGPFCGACAEGRHKQAFSYLTVADCLQKLKDPRFYDMWNSVSVEQDGSGASVVKPPEMMIGQGCEMSKRFGHGIISNLIWMSESEIKAFFKKSPEQLNLVLRKQVNEWGVDEYRL